MTLDVGFIDDVFAVMKGEAEHMSNMEKICIISLDGMYLSNRVEFEPYQQQILGPYNCVQVMCAHGLFGKWKQPIFFYFNFDMTVEYFK